MREFLQVKRERRRRDAQVIGDLACGKTFWTDLNQQAKDVEPALLGKRSQRAECGFFLHA